MMIEIVVGIIVLLGYVFAWFGVKHIEVYKKGEIIDTRMKNKMNRGVIFILLGLIIILLGVFVTYTMALGIPRISVDLGQEYEVIAIGMTKGDNRYLVLREVESEKVFLYQTTFNKLSICPLVIPGDTITILNDKTIVVTNIPQDRLPIYGCG